MSLKNAWSFLPHFVYNLSWLGDMLAKNTVEGAVLSPGTLRAGEVLPLML